MTYHRSSKTSATKITIPGNQIMATKNNHQCRDSQIATLLLNVGKTQNTSKLIQTNPSYTFDHLCLVSCVSQILLGLPFGSCPSHSIKHDDMGWATCYRLPIELWLLWGRNDWNVKMCPFQAASGKVTGVALGSNNSQEFLWYMFFFNMRLINGFCFMVFCLCAYSKNVQELLLNLSFDKFLFPIDGKS
jgi:hypothetical protein